MTVLIVLELVVRNKYGLPWKLRKLDPNGDVNLNLFRNWLNLDKLFGIQPYVRAHWENLNKFLIQRVATPSGLTATQKHVLLFNCG